MSDIFISYASEDRDRVRVLADALSSRGWSVWSDRQIPTGKTFDQVIIDALADAKCVMVVWSRESVASSWVREEADEGRKRGVLIPVLIDEVRPPLGFGRIQAASMIGWNGASDSEAFQKLAADIAAVIGAPAPPEPTPPIPPTPEPGSAAKQAVVIAWRKVKAVARRFVRGRMVRLSLAGALVLALLAVAVYRTRPRGGDPSQPRPTRIRADASGLRLNAILVDGGEPLPRGVAYAVYTAARDADGKRKLVSESSQFSDAPRFPLPPGRYFVAATHGSASAGTEVDVTAGEVTHQILNLRAGILRLTAVLTAGGEPLGRGVAYEVSTVARDADGKRKQVTESSQFADPPRFPLPAGRYFVAATHGSASAGTEVDVAAGGVTNQILNLGAGILRLTAVLAEGGEPLRRGVSYEVFTAARDAEGKRKRVTESSQFADPPRFPLPAGRYFVAATHGSASADMELDVAAGGVTNQILNLRAGILRLTAVLTEGGEPLRRGVVYEVYTAARDADGNRKRVTESSQFSDPPRFPLPAGRYFVTAAHGSGKASAETAVTAGDTQSVQLRILPQKP